MLGEIIQLITEVGFPIVAVIGVAWYCKYTNDCYREDTKKLNEKHENEIDKLTEALNNNTVALTKLCEKMN